MGSTPFQGTGRLLDGDRVIARVEYDLRLTDDIRRGGGTLAGTPDLGGVVRGTSPLSIPDDQPFMLKMDDHHKEVFVYIAPGGAITAAGSLTDLSGT